MNNSEETTYEIKMDKNFIKYYDIGYVDGVLEASKEYIEDFKNLKAAICNQRELSENPSEKLGLSGSVLALNVVIEKINTVIREYQE